MKQKFRFLFVIFIFIFLRSYIGYANNVKVSGEPVLTLNARADSVEIAFNLSWQNSWRDEFNWDAAWVFMKFKKENTTTAWGHINPGSAVVPSDLAFDFGKTNNKAAGVFIFRNTKGGGDLTGKSVKLTAALSEFTGVTADEIRNKKVYVAVSAVEMVYIPYGAYYLGDGVSKNSFKSVQQRIILPEDDIIGTDPKFTYTSFLTPYGACYPENAADRFNDANWVAPYNHIYYVSSENHGAAAAKNNHLTIDFKGLRTIREFGLSGSTWYGNHNPMVEWYLLASNDLTVWDTIWAGNPEKYITTAISYPVRHAIRVQKPGAYRYYRTFVPEVSVTGLLMANVAMSEKESYPGSTDGYLVESENVTMGKSLNQLYADDGKAWSGAMSVNYPKGYRGFYCMKYELSQEQYVSFLNMLNRNQQTARIGNPLAGLVKGNYVFGDKTRPNARNGICVFSNNSDRPALFANNLNPASPYYGEDDGQTIACNYLTPEDMMAYSDWAGLRPMSEMEYEKACHTPFPKFPAEGEYAWNNGTLLPLSGSSDVSAQQTENEAVINAKNANAGNRFGPVRSGSFGVGTASQTKAGAGFWGVMEMSGNLGEICYSATPVGRAFNALDPNLTHGNGVINDNGTTDMTAYWPAWTSTEAFAVRGGSFASGKESLQTSDRNILAVAATRDSTLGFRAVRTYGGVAQVKAGAIICENGLMADTACPATPMTIRNKVSGEVSNVSDVPLRYLWYINDVIVPGEQGQDLVYTFENAGAAVVEYVVKRKAVCAVGEAVPTAETTVRIKVPNTVIKLSQDTVSIDYNNLSTQIIVSARMTGVSDYKWIYAGKVVGTGVKLNPSRDHFNGATGEQIIRCEIPIMGCLAEKKLKVNISRERAMPSNAISMADCGSVLAIDSRDNKRYSTVRFTDAAGENAQCWFGRNINVGSFTLGTDYNTHTVAGIQKICMANDSSYCDVYGGLYRWEEVAYGEKNDGTNKMNGAYVQGICPTGWHVPSDEEWKRLEMNLGMTEAQANSANFWNRGSDIGDRMKVGKVFDGRLFCNGSICNSSGFNTLPTGFRNVSGGGFLRNVLVDSGVEGTGWWTVTSGSNSAYAHCRYVYNGYSSVHRDDGNLHAKTYGMNVRCIKD